MATIYYVRSTDGDDGSDGLSWTNAKATLAGALALAVAGDRIWVSQAHAETNSGAIAITSAGTPNNPIEILCGNDAAEPPSVLAATATITSTGNNALNISGSFYCYGIAFIQSGGGGSQAINLGNSVTNTLEIFESCFFRMGTNAAPIGIGTASVTLLSVKFINTQIKFGATTQHIRPYGGTISFTGTTPLLESGSSVPTDLIKAVTTGAVGSRFTFDNIDLSAQTGSGKYLLNPATSQVLATFRNVKLGAEITPVNGQFVNPLAQIIVDCSDGANKYYRMYRQTYSGSVQEETTKVIV